MATGFGAAMTLNICTVVTQQAGFQTKDQVRLDGPIADCVANISAQPVSVTKEASPSAIFMTPPIRFKCPFVCSVFSFSLLYPWRGTEVDPYHPLSPTFLCSIGGEQKQKIGSNPHLSKQMLNPDSKGMTFASVSFFC